METDKKPMVELRDIYKSFGNVEVLKGISATIDRGELLTFVGPSGCGKTTLGKMLADHIGYCFTDIDEMIVNDFDTIVSDVSAYDYDRW